MNQQKPENPSNPEKPSKHRPALWRIAISTVAAAFGVQSNKNREHDFQHTTVLPFIVAGVAFTLLFIGTLVLVVSLVLR